MKRIHIVGCGPRSGTTLIAEMMIACFHIDLHISHENSIYKIPPRNAEIFLTKRPIDVLMVEPVLKSVPDLHVIYMLRDPRDMVVSRHGKAPDKCWSSLSYWKTYTRFGRKLKSHPRFTTVCHEKLLTAPDDIQKYLIERMPFLVKKAEFSRFHALSDPYVDSLQALGGVRPISGSSIGNWRRNLPRIAGQLHVHGSITEDLREFGYEKDDSWLEGLTSVEPDFSPSYLPETFSKTRLRRILRKRNLKAVIVFLCHYAPTNVFMRVMAKGYEKMKGLKTGSRFPAPHLERGSQIDPRAEDS